MARSTAPGTAALLLAMSVAVPNSGLAGSVRLDPLAPSTAIYSVDKA